LHQVGIPHYVTVASSSLFILLKSELLLNFYVTHNTSKVNRQIHMMYMFSVPFVSLHSITIACRSGANFRDRSTTSY